ncbi:inositol monophosphatase [Nocardioides sp. cx-169]|uniref:inositol monophosphatase family protein n=1 Tax=Nocardioides sp. cx-169 TaxID=2899080 RepID=UPI001E534A9F|nr:inositol monophosphatase family protein [Nocardioides sp. cx-169]MCD4534883.1 inositol monophosphatase [Nocardioides sp. cx-169]
MTTRPDPAALADLALETARLAAELVRGRQAAGVSVAATKSSDVDIVTEADQAAEALIRDTIRARRPDDAFLGEEGEAETGTTGVRWIIDPIDGTVNFLYGLPQYAVSIAAELDGEVVAGVVLNAATGLEYVAREDDGRLVATRDGRAIAVRGEAPLSHRLIGTGFSYDREVRVVQAQAVTRLLPHIRDVRRLGSAALDMCAVADGQLDGYIEEGVHLWDHAAAGLIARAAGARTELAQGAGGLTLMLCAPAHGFEEFREATRQAGFMAPVTIAGNGE